MQLNHLAVAFVFGIASALPGASPSETIAPPPYSNSVTYTSDTAAPPPDSTYASWTPSSTPDWTPTYTSSWGPIYTHDCGGECGGECGDGIVQAPEECDLGVVLNNTPGSGCDPTCHKTACCGDGVVKGNEECDAGSLNGAYNSGCSTNCTLCGYCGDGIVDDGEQCDLGWKVNGTPGANCTSDCTICNVPPVTCNCSCCAEGTATGSTEAECEANCQAKCPNNATCQTCNPIPSLNFCDITTSCITTPTTNDYCACRAGYKADGLSDIDPKQFRLAFPGQEYRVFVAPGVSCNTLCDVPFPGPISCQEIPVESSC